MKEKNGHKSDGKNRIIIIGLDSADPLLIQKWAAEGRLPYISSLIERGVWARLISPGALFPDAVWPSFNCGVNPAKHGFYNAIELKRGTTDLVRVDAHYCFYLPFWSLLRSAGKRVAVLDAPKSYPVEGVDGIQVAAWGEHYPLMKQTSLPAALCEEITARFGKYPHPREMINPWLVSQQTRLYEKVISNIDRRIEVAQFLMAQENWDLFLTVFGEPHYAGHQFFHHWERSHWAHDPKSAARLADTLPNTYAKLDSALSALTRVEPEDNLTVFIVSVHGIAVNYSANHAMPEVMEKLGFQVGLPVNPGAGLLRVLPGTNGLRSLIPKRIREFINENIVPESFHDRVVFHEFASRIDWKRSKAFVLPSDHFQGFISVNLQGREPHGFVRAGREYDEVCAQIRYELKRLVNPATGKPAIYDVVQTSKVYGGEFLYELPDLVIQWAEDAPIHQLHHPAFGLLATQSDGLRKSKHAGYGFMIACGEHIKKGALLDTATPMDLAPTILYLLGQEIPKGMDGRILFELIGDDYKSRHQAHYADWPLIVPREMRL